MEIIKDVVTTPILTVPKVSVVYAKVLFDFHASSSTEVSLKVGETIEVIQRGPSGGWSRSSKGAFPTDYVEFVQSAVIPASKVVSQPTTKTDISSAFEDLLPSTVVQMASATPPFASAVEVSTSVKQDTSFSAFDQFAPSIEVSQNPVKVSNSAVLQPNKRQSMTVQKESSFALELQQSGVTSDEAQVVVKTVKPELTKTSSSSALKKTETASSAPSVFALVKFSKAAGSATELSITEGETLLVLKQDGEWWYGSTIGANAKKGFFPYNYVEVKAASAVVTPLTVTPLAAVAPVAKTTVAMVDKASVNNYQVKYSNIGLDGSRYVFESLSAESGVRSPVWHQPVFLDLFADKYKKVISESDAEMIANPAVKRLGHTLSVVDKALSLISLSGELVDGMADALSRGAHLVREGMEVCAQLPARSNDTLKFFTFLMFFMSRVRALRAHDSMIVPTSWTADDGRDHAVILLLSKISDDQDSNYSVTVINSGSEPFQGLDYHAMNVDPTHGQIQRNLSCELPKILNEKITNSAFW